MGKRYAIWDRKSDVYCPGTDPDVKELTYSTERGTSRFTAEEWLARHPVPPSAVIICAAGDYNGAIFDTLGRMMQKAREMGADFSGAETDEEKLAVIEAFEDAMNEAAANAVSLEEREVAALEALVLQGMDDI